MFFVEEFLPKSQTFILNQIKWISDSYDVLVVCLKLVDKTNPEIFTIKLLEFNETPFLKLSKRFSTTRLNLAFKRKLNSVVANFNPDIIHCHFFTQAITLLDNLNYKKIPVVITFHGYDVTKRIQNSFLYKRKVRSILSKINVFPIFVCNYHKNFIAGKNINVSKSTVLHNAINVKNFQRTEYPSRDKEIRFIQICRFVPKKGHLFTIRAFKKYLENNPNSKVKLRFVGDGPLLGKCQKLVTRFSLEERISFIPWIPKEKVAIELSDAHYYIQHSITSESNDTEGMPISIIEAMSMELPILSTFHSGIPELVQNNINGILIEEMNIDQYLQAITEICKMPYLKTNSQRVSSLFNEDKRNELLIQHYRNLISKFSNSYE